MPIIIKNLIAKFYLRNAKFISLSHLRSTSSLLPRGKTPFMPGKRSRILNNPGKGRKLIPDADEEEEDDKDKANINDKWISEEDRLESLGNNNLKNLRFPEKNTNNNNKLIILLSESKSKDSASLSSLGGILSTWSNPNFSYKAMPLDLAAPQTSAAR